MYAERVQSSEKGVWTQTLPPAQLGSSRGVCPVRDAGLVSHTCFHFTAEPTASQTQRVTVFMSPVLAALTLNVRTAVRAEACRPVRAVQTVDPGGVWPVGDNEQKPLGG